MHLGRAARWPACAGAARTPVLQLATRRRSARAEWHGAMHLVAPRAGQPAPRSAQLNATTSNSASLRCCPLAQSRQSN
eukprot:4666720-Pyramimonas_sp.AAC.1